MIDKTHKLFQIVKEPFGAFSYCNMKFAIMSHQSKVAIMIKLPHILVSLCNLKCFKDNLDIANNNKELVSIVMMNLVEVKGNLNLNLV